MSRSAADRRTSLRHAAAARLQPLALAVLVLGVSCSAGPHAERLGTVQAPATADACVRSAAANPTRAEPARPAAEEPMESWYFLYSCDLPYGSVVVTVFPAGESTARVNVNLGGLQEIGEYRRALPAEQTARLREVVRASGYAELPEAAPARPGTPFVMLAEGREGSPPATPRSFPLADLPERLLPVMETMRTVIDAIREGRYRVIGGTARFVNDAPRAGDDLVVELTVRNVGEQAVEIANPAGALADANVGLHLYIARDVPDTELRDGDVAGFDFARDSVRLAPAPGSDFERPGTTITLAPGAELRLQASKKVLLPPGRYKAAVTFHNQSDRTDPEQSASGSLSLDLGTITIR